MALNSPNRLGRILVATVATLIFGFISITTYFIALPIGWKIVRLVVMAILLVLLYRGHRWARLFVVALIALALVVYLYVYLSGHPWTVRDWIVVFFYCVTIYFLAWSKAVREFLDSQKATHRNVA
jgi:hypothetical protein